VASSQLPLHYLLALKSPYSPLVVLTQSSHETLNNLHQLLGRVVTCLLYVHTVLYINFYVLSNLLATKITEWYVICGIVGILAFTAVGTTALAPVRKWSYRVFYVVHVTLATALLPVLFFHVSHIRIYLYETAAVYALNVLLRALNSRTLPSTIALIPGTTLLRIEVPLPKTTSETRSWQPGQHAYISLPGHPLSRTFRSNPFTVASLPAVDGTLRFVARILDGNTAKLARRSTATRQTQPLTLEGPYGVTTHPDRLLQYDRILLVAGGVGATFVVPIYRQLLADLSPSKGSYRRQKVHFVWIARSRAEVMWAMPGDKKEREGFTERLSVYLTGSAAANGGFAVGRDAEEEEDDGGNGKDKTAFGEPDDGIELEEREKLLDNNNNSTIEPPTSDLLTTHPGRPDLANLVNRTFSLGHAREKEKVAIVVCGPKSLTAALRAKTERWVVEAGREVWFWEEGFAL